MAVIGILGAGAWGTALALAAQRAGNEVRLWARDPEARARLGRGLGPRQLPDIGLPPGIAIVDEATDLAGLDTVLLAVPAQALRRAIAPLAASRAVLVSCAKGLELGTGLRTSQVIEAVAPKSVPAVLSGPSFAAEVAAGLPTAVTIAAAEIEQARTLCRLLASPGFRPYPSDDPIGVEIGGALKNVVAIAAGVVMGRDLGENARAAVITRGLAELTRLGAALGCRRETLMGLSGLGDLMLTATSLTSRNTSLGHALGRGMAPAQLLAPGQKLSEGAWTAAAACDLGRSHGVELPIAEAVRAVIAGEMDIARAIDGLLTRPLAEGE